MRNLGPVSRGWLAELDIRSEDDVRRLGAIPVWVHVKARHPDASLNLLWALMGLESGEDWRTIDSGRKDQARAELRRRGLI